MRRGLESRNPAPGHVGRRVAKGCTEQPNIICANSTKLNPHNMDVQDTGLGPWTLDRGHARRRTSLPFNVGLRTPITTPPCSASSSPSFNQASPLPAGAVLPTPSPPTTGRTVRTVFAVRTRSPIQGALLLPQHWPVHKVTWRSAKCMARFAHPPLEVPVVIPHEAPGEGTAEASPTAPCTPTTATTLPVDDHEEAKREPLGARAGNDPLHSLRAPRQAHGGVIPHLVTHAAGEFALPLRTRGGLNKLGKALWPIWLRAHGRTAGTWHGTWHGQ